jgi:hypothetical protein
VYVSVGSNVTSVTNNSIRQRLTSVANTPSLKIIQLEIEIRLRQHTSLPRALPYFECGDGSGIVTRVVRRHAITVAV